MQRFFVPVIVCAVLIGLWQGVIWATGVPRFILPSPIAVAQELYTNAQLIGVHTWITLQEVFLGFVIGAVLGLLSAITLAEFPWARRVARPLLVISQAIPVFALAPILTLWLGFGMASKVTMAVLIIYFPITSAFFDGLTHTPQGYLDIAQTMNGRKNRILWHIRIPAALPKLGSGLRLAAVYAPLGAVIGEWVGSSQGLGYLMLLANGRSKPELMFASVAVLALVSLTLYLAIDAALRRAGY
ncbi:MAG: ABC transporter permease [Pseudomonadota bacterium]